MAERDRVVAGALQAEVLVGDRQPALHFQRGAAVDERAGGRGLAMSA